MICVAEFAEQVSLEVVGQLHAPALTFYSSLSSIRKFSNRGHFQTKDSPLTVLQNIGLAFVKHDTWPILFSGCFQAIFKDSPSLMGVTGIFKVFCDYLSHIMTCEKQQRNLTLEVRLKRCAGVSVFFCKSDS